MNKLKRSFHLLLALILAGTVVASSNITAKAQGDQAEIAKVEQLLQQSGFGYRKITEKVWLIDRQGTSMPKFQIIVTTASGFMLMGVVVAAKNTINRTPEMMFSLLKLSNELDYSKLGFDDDDDLFVRTEFKLRLIDLPEFKESVERLTKQTDQIHTAIKQYLKTP